MKCTRNGFHMKNDRLEGCVSKNPLMWSGVAQGKSYEKNFICGNSYDCEMFVLPAQSRNKMNSNIPMKNIEFKKK